MDIKALANEPIWQAARKLLSWIYHVTRDFPAEAQQGLVRDMRWVANDLTQGIAEALGCVEARQQREAYEQARGVCLRLASQLLVSYELRFLVSKSELDGLLDSVQKIIENLDGRISGQTTG